MDKHSVSNNRKLQQEIHATAQKLETIARDLRRIMKELNSNGTFTSEHEKLISLTIPKDLNLIGKSPQKQALSPYDKQDGLIQPAVRVTPPRKDLTSSKAKDQHPDAMVPTNCQTREDRDTCFPDVDSDEDIQQDLSSLEGSLSDQQQKQPTTPAKNYNRDSGVLISDNEDSILFHGRPSDANGNSPRDFQSLLTLKNRPVNNDFYAWNPPQPRPPQDLAKAYKPFHQCLNDDPEDEKDSVVNEASPISIRSRLNRTMYENKDYRPVLGTEMNFILIFLNEMHKINRFTRKHFPETCVYSSKPRRVLHFMTTVSRNWTEHSALVESFKREAPIFWEVFGTSLQNGMMIPNDFQLENTNLNPGDVISHDRFTELVRLIRARRDSNLKP
jgi:hypothetical protein